MAEELDDCMCYPKQFMNGMPMLRLWHLEQIPCWLGEVVPGVAVARRRLHSADEILLAEAFPHHAECRRAFGGLQMTNDL